MGGDKLTSQPVPEQGSKLSLHFDASGAPQTRSAEVSTEKSPFRTNDKQGDNSNSPNSIETYLAQQERARAPYEVPKTSQESQKNLARDREATNTAGIPKERTITTQTGEQIKGIKVVDDATKEHRFIAADKDGKYNQYTIQENGKKLQPLDTSGKPVGDPILTNKAKPAESTRNTAEEAAKAMDGNGKRHELPEWATKRDGDKGPRSENKDGSDKTPPVAKTSDATKADSSKTDLGKTDSSKADSTKVDPGSKNETKATADQGYKPRQEWNRDKDGDGKPDFRQPKDRDGDGKPDFRPGRDRDGDGKPDFRPGRDRDGDGKADAGKKDPGSKDAPKDQPKDTPKQENPKQENAKQDDPRGSRGEVDNTRFGKPIQPDAKDQGGQQPQPKQAQDWQRPDFANRNNRGDLAQAPQVALQRPDGPNRADNPNLRADNPNFRPDGRPDFNGRPDRGDFQNKDFPGRRDFQGREDVPGRRDFSANNDFAGRPDLKGRIDMNARPDFASVRADLANLNATRGDTNLRGPRDASVDGRADGLRSLDRALTADIMSRLNSHDATGRDLIGRELAGRGDFSGRGLDGKSLTQLLDGQRMNLKENTFQSFRSNADVLTNLNRTIGTNQLDSLGKMPGKAGLDGDRPGLAAGKMIDGKLMDSKIEIKDLGKSATMLQNAMSELSGKMLTNRLLEMTQKLDFGKIPNQEQTNNAIREMSRIQKNEMGTAQDLLSSIQKNLAQKNNEVAPANNSFVAKGLEINQQQTLRTKEQESNKDQKTETITKNVDNTANKAQQNQQNQILTAKNADSVNQNQTQKQEQTRTGRDSEDHTNPNGKPFQQSLVQAEKAHDHKQDTQSNRIQENKQDDKKHLEDDKKNKMDLKEDNKQDQMAGLIAAAKLKELKDKEKAKEKEDIKDKSKQDPKQKTRLKYRVKKNDTLALIAEKFLGSNLHAASIFHINRTMIPVTTYDGKSFANPQVDSMIWIPTDDDVEIFKNSGVLKNYADISFAGVTYASAEDELAARFGQRWFGPSEEEKQISSGSATSPERQIRRSNIENQLGSFDNCESRGDGRIRYTVRLGETLKSIALKHPLLKDVDMWKLIARVNNMSEDIDERGAPIVTLKRGMSILLPTHDEAESFRSSKPARKLSTEQMLPALPISEISAIMQR